MRIAMMVLRLFYKVPYYMLRIWFIGLSKVPDYARNYLFVRHVTIQANRAGKVRIEAHGVENIPKEDGFIFYPNHQGLYDVLAIIESSPAPFAFVYKKEVSNVILLKQVMRALGALAIDRQDLKQSMQVIRQMTDEVGKGRNFLIFAEGTRSKKGNQLLEFKGGSFKAAQKARCPIVPCALIDSFKPFDENTVQQTTVKVIYLPPMLYEEYKEMRTVDIAEEVKHRIEEAIAAYTADSLENSK